jgi:hypothetical protein
VEFRLKFNGGKEGSTQKLRKIVKTGDIAGISIDASFFKIEGKFELHLYSVTIRIVCLR